MVCRVRVPQTGQHVCDRISHGHELAFGLSRRGFLVRHPSPRSETGRVRRGGPTA
ncbi:30S ribosomal protein S8 [Streptomyces griseoviridis]|uniref:30S ribosomal protein S8 n=2 Tax=Streptomyces TaxID=1883 RepID=A0A3S9ZCS1_STRGD|nr:30S ribosomal protein S8 [Streptomyces griseoviridis]PNG21461.1 30S ribosomal protein S8 [Streptomyces cahuitamycinicus]PTH88144.1 30S ribosomal protein S8 [Streptomyces sp. A244]QCN90726.1 30S ribosomal protein S8 [Streptomyces griseoviridis]